MKKSVIIGSAGTLAENYIQKYPSENFICLDINNQGSFDDPAERNAFNFDVLNNEDQLKLSKYCLDNDYEIESIIFFQGINFMSDFFSLTSTKWNETMDLNVKSIVFTLKNLFSSIKKKCSIVVIASQHGIAAHENRVDYGASKAALIHLVKLLSVEFSRVKEKDIRINSISPGYIYSEKSKNILDSYVGKRLMERIPYKKFVVPEDVSGTIDFLVSDKSVAIRGQNIAIDYGYTLI